jgi:uncharacterized protein (TIRG00374 family)
LPDNRKKSSWTLKIALTLAFAALVFVALLVYAGLDEILGQLRDFGWWAVAPALALAFGNYLARFLKWQYYCRVLSIPVRTADSFIIFMSGLSMSISPGKFGEVLKSFLLKKIAGTPVSFSAPIVLAERMTDLVGLLVLAAAAMAFLPFEGWMAALRWFFVATAAAVVALVLALGSARFAGAFLGVFSRLPLAGRAADKMSAALQSAVKLFTFKNFALMSALSAVSWAFECAGFYIVLAAFNVPSPDAPSVVFIYCAGTILGAVSMLPGGLGLTEFSMVGMLVQMLKTGGAQAVAATTVIRACTLWFATIIGVVFLVAGRRRFSVNALELEEMPDAGLAQKPASNAAH